MFLIAGIFVFWSGYTIAQEDRSIDFTALSLEELMDVEVTIASKKEQPLFKTAAAIHVLTREQIRRSGATSIPEALRLVPGLHVARVDASKWAISSRGFNNLFANKLLVMIDGRSVYTPLFAGVHWDVQDVMIEDIDRIEVIRGPGASLWGANAVNGVINIITRRASNTQGILVTGGGGSEEQGFVSSRFGGQLSPHAFYRIYARYFNRDESQTPAAAQAGDAWNVIRSGFRLDWQAGHQDTLTFQGDIYDGDAGQKAQTPIPALPYTKLIHANTSFSGGNFLTRWTRTWSPTSTTTLQGYYDRTNRTGPIGSIARNTFDVDFQHRWVLHERYELVWGLREWFSNDAIAPLFPFSIAELSRGLHLTSFFVTNEIDLIPNRMRLTLGTKLSRSSVSGLEILPDARLLVTPHPRHALWASIARAVRTPSRSEQGLDFVQGIIPNPNGSLSFITIQGNRTKAEDLVATEFGYRLKATDQWSFDLATFYNKYNELGSSEPDVPFFDPSPPVPHVVVPIRFANQAEGETYGGELTATWQALPEWQLQATYTGLNINLRILPTAGPGTVLEFHEGDSPHHQFMIRSTLDLPKDIEVDAILWYIGQLSTQGVPRYTRLDLHLGWNPVGPIGLSLVGQNLLDSGHLEFGDSITGVRATQMQRSVYGKVSLRF